MLLVADSGSTKCDWLFTSTGQEEGRFHTMGFNPFFHSSELIANEILANKELAAMAPKVEQLFFYGAGASSLDRCAVVENGLKHVFKNATIVVDHDLTGAVYATCGTEPGISCILGTGSNSCYFDGAEIHEEVPALGYVLGDEASGTFYGKELLRLFLYNELPTEIHDGLIETYGLTKEEIFAAVYNRPNANVYLASFMRFLSDHRENRWVRDLIYNGFSQFINIHIWKYKMHKEVPIHFVGSVAFHFQELLREACKIHRLQVGVITSEPVVNLLSFHWDNR
jgi:N-acetylglucosamine kinase-like BadF-type ATPase